LRHAVLSAPPTPAPRWRLWIWAASLLLIALLAAAAFAALASERRTIVRSTGETARQSAQLLGIVVDQMIRDIDGVVAGLQLAATATGDAGALRDETWAWLVQRMSERPAVQSYLLLDQDGLVQRSSQRSLIGLSHADRLHFQVHRDSTGAGIARFAPDPFLAAATGYRMLLVTWALRGADGRFAGALVVGFDTDVVESRLGRLVDIAHDIVALVKGDRVILAAAGVQGTQMLDPAHWDIGLAELVALGRQGDGEAAVTRETTLFGKRATWMAHVQPLAMLDGCVVLVRNLDRVLASWRLHVLAATVTGGLLVIAIVASASALTMLFDRQRRALVVATSDSLVDPLTSLFNRRLFDDQAKGELARARRLGEELALLMVDIDHFKAVNDRHGHAVGDAVLVAVGNCLKAQLRREDLLARIGGEEFAILVPRLPVAAALRQAERLRRAIEGLSIETDGITVRITISIGIAEVGDGDRPLTDALAAADAALYRAKAAGRNRVVLAQAPPAAARISA
jgi:diguanylate cyclase (GGDEF)-like protein